MEEGQLWYFAIRAKIVHFEDEHPKLKEITMILELALWKMKMNEDIPQENETNCQKAREDNVVLLWS